MFIFLINRNELLSSDHNGRRKCILVSKITFHDKGFSKKIIIDIKLKFTVNKNFDTCFTIQYNLLII